MTGSLGLTVINTDGEVAATVITATVSQSWPRPLLQQPNPPLWLWSPLSPPPFKTVPFVKSPCCYGPRVMLLPWMPMMTFQCLRKRHQPGPACGPITHSSMGACRGFGWQPGACASLPSKGCWLLELPLAGSHLCCHTGGAELTKSCFQALQMELGLLGPGENR